MEFGWKMTIVFCQTIINLFKLINNGTSTASARFYIIGKHFQCTKAYLLKLCIYRQVFSCPERSPFCINVAKRQKLEFLCFEAHIIPMPFLDRSKFSAGIRVRGVLLKLHILFNRFSIRIVVKVDNRERIGTYLPPLPNLGNIVRVKDNHNHILLLYNMTITYTYIGSQDWSVVKTRNAFLKSIKLSFYVDCLDTRGSTDDNKT